MPELKSRLLVVTDRRETKGRPLLSVLDHAMSGGRLAIQLRERDLPTQDLLALARDVAARAQTRNAQLLINDRADVALTLEGAGVHLRASSLPVSVTRRLLGPNRLVGVSAHSVEEAARAESEGADYIVIGPIYPTPSKESFGPPLGLARLEEACRRVAIPVLAIGGVTLTRAAEVRRAGAFGVAVIRAICGAPNEQDAARRLLAALDSGP